MIKKIILTLVTVSLISCGDSGSTVTVISTSGTASGNAAITISGSAGDGPITGGSVMVTDVSGSIVVTTPANLISDNSAHFNFSIPTSTNMPITIIISGGMDQVTGRKQDFPLKTAVSSLPPSGQIVANASPLSTIIVESAKSMIGGVTSVNLTAASTNALNMLSFGLPAGVNPISTIVTNANAAPIVKANEGLAELIRRTSVSGGLGLVNTIALLAADITDGVLDGVTAIGVSNLQLSPSLAAIALTQQAIISSELITNAMTVTTAGGVAIPAASGVSFVNKMNAALALTQPTVSGVQADIAQVVPTSAFISQSNLAIGIASRLAGVDPTINVLQTLFSNIQADRVPSAGQLVALSTALQNATVGLNQAESNASSGVNVALSFDSIAPVVIAPKALTVEAVASLTAVMLGTATVTDNVDVNLIATASPSGPYGVGAHQITWSATDAAGNAGSATQSVTILAPVATTAVTMQYTYDANGRITSAIYSNGNTITFSYDSEGNLTSENIQ